MTVGHAENLRDFDVGRYDGTESLEHLVFVLPFFYLKSPNIIVVSDFFFWNKFRKQNPAIVGILV